MYPNSNSRTMANNGANILAGDAAAAAANCCSGNGDKFILPTSITFTRTSVAADELVYVPSADKVVESKRGSNLGTQLFSVRELNTIVGGAGTGDIDGSDITGLKAFLFSTFSKAYRVSKINYSSSDEGQLSQPITMHTGSITGSSNVRVISTSEYESSSMNNTKVISLFMDAVWNSSTAMQVKIADSGVRASLNFTISSFVANSSLI